MFISKTPVQNTHLPHPEDSVLTGDLSCLDWFVNPGNISVKIDGAPAIVFGTDPANGNFFVGTKSVFNKVKIKIAHSHEEIDALYEGEVATILHACFDNLPRISGIVQGDFLGFGGDNEYCPNTITYQFPDVVTEKIIFAPHTFYTSTTTLRDAVASPLQFNFENETHPNPFVKWVQPKASILYDADSFDVDEVCAFAKQMAQLVTFATDKEAKKIVQQLNACIRAGEEVNPEDFDCDPNLIRFWALVKSIKDDCLFLLRNDGPAAYLGSPYAGYERIDAEGYVMTNEFGMFKLVNREVFSHANFNQGRFQSASH